jgi:hypothetical protein
LLKQGISNTISCRPAPRIVMSRNDAVPTRPRPSRRPRPRPRRPRQPAVPGRAFPTRPRPEASLESSRAACHRLSAPHRPGARHGPPVRRRRPTIREPVEAGYHGGIFVVRCHHPVSSRPINTPRSPRSHRHCPTAVPSAPPPSSCVPACLPRSSNRSCPFPRPYSTVAGHLLSRPSPCRRQSRATAAAAAGPRRSPTPAQSPPQLWPPLGPR